MEKDTESEDNESVTDDELSCFFLLYLRRGSQKWSYTHVYISPIVPQMDPAERSLES